MADWEAGVNWPIEGHFADCWTHERECQSLGRSNQITLLLSRARRGGVVCNVCFTYLYINHNNNHNNVNQRSPRRGSISAAARPHKLRVLLRFLFR